jgi:hypothetical protein
MSKLKQISLAVLIAASDHFSVVAKIGFAGKGKE